MTNRQYCSFCGNLKTGCDCKPGGPRIASLPADVDETVEFVVGPGDFVDSADNPRDRVYDNEAWSRFVNGERFGEILSSLAYLPCPTCGSTESICDCCVNDDGELIVPAPPKQEPEI